MQVGQCLVGALEQGRLGVQAQFGIGDRLGVGVEALV